MGSIGENSTFSEHGHVAYQIKGDNECSNMVANILRKTIEGYLGSVPSLTFNTIKNLLIMYAFQSSRHLQSKWMLYFSHASMVQIQYTSKWFNPLY